MLLFMLRIYCDFNNGIDETRYSLSCHGSVADLEVRESIERAQRAPVDMYWRELSPLERALVWLGFVAFGVTVFAAIVWGVIAPDAK
jgi:hypothetical protein